jgi:hypothetical protein
VPFKSPSAVLQTHLNEEHAAHQAAVNAAADKGVVQCNFKDDSAAPRDQPATSQLPK